MLSLNFFFVIDSMSKEDEQINAVVCHLSFTPCHNLFGVAVELFFYDWRPL